MSFRVAYNGLRLCAGGVLKYESSKLAQKPIRITAVDVSTSAPLAQNRCYRLFFFGRFVKSIIFNN